MLIGEESMQESDDSPQAPEELPREVTALGNPRDDARFNSLVDTMQRVVDRSVTISVRDYAILGAMSIIDMVGNREVVGKEFEELQKTLAENYPELPFRDQAATVEQDSITTTCTEPDSYKYPPLHLHPSAIRLVVLRPSLEWSADIVCDLCNSALTQSASDSYEALSYVWGDPTKRRPIIINGQPFQATENLEMALRSLRYRSKPRVLWIDAICINQNDIAERNEQVQLMGHIYRRAGRVVIWLGPESETSGIAFRFMEDTIGKEVPGKDSANLEIFTEFWDRFLPALPAFVRLATRPWFSRVWCIQELALARNVDIQCGQHSAAMAHFVGMYGTVAEATENNWGPILACTELTKADIIKMAKFSTLLRLHSKLLTAAMMGADRAADSSDSVLHLLNRFQDWMCSNDKDRIFAFYGLVPAGSPDRAALFPNYSLSTAQVYTRFAVRYLQNHRDLNILLVATRPVRDYVDISSERELPSWVPDWRDTSRHGKCLIHMTIGIHSLAFNLPAPQECMFDTMYDACLGLQVAPLEFRNDFRMLCLDGIMVDKIEDIAPIYSYEASEVAKTVEILAAWKDIAAPSMKSIYRYTGEPGREAFWRTLQMDDELINMPKNKNAAHQRFYQYRKDGLRRSRIPRMAPGLVPAEEYEAQRFISGPYVFGPMRGRRLFRTAKGLIGLGPASTRMADDVVVLFGARAPFVLRPDGESHRVIGECYVHGIMDGEAIHQPRREEFTDLSTKEFHLV